MDKSTPFTHPPDDYRSTSGVHELSIVRDKLEAAQSMLLNERAKNEALVSKLVAIQGCMCPPDVKHPDGHWLEFNPPEKAVKDAWRQLTNTIRTLDVSSLNRDHAQHCELMKHLGAFGAVCTCDYDAYGKDQ